MTDQITFIIRIDQIGSFFINVDQSRTQSIDTPNFGIDIVKQDNFLIRQTHLNDNDKNNKKHISMQFR